MDSGDESAERDTGDPIYHDSQSHDSDDPLLADHCEKAGDKGLEGYCPSSSDESLIGGSDTSKDTEGCTGDIGYIQASFPMEQDKESGQRTEPCLQQLEAHENIACPYSEETEPISADDILNNPTYTDSVSSNDSKKALLGSDYDGNLHYTVIDGTGDNITNDTVEETDPDIDVIRDRSNTMSRLAESSAYIDAIGYTPDHTRLSRACRNAVLALSQEVFQKYASTQMLPKGQDVPKSTTVEDAEVEDLTYISRHKKNLIFLSISITLYNTAIGSLRNLQSSMNHESGVGLYSLAASYCAYMIFSLFTPFVIQKFKPKKCLMFSLLPQLLYVIANLFPTFYIFIPASFLQGLGNALLWNSMSTYTTYLARARALQKDEKTVHIASRYFGIFFFFYQFSVVTGNLISSLVLLYGDGQPDHSEDIPPTSLLPEFVTVPEVNLSYGFNQSSPIWDTTTSHFSLCGAKYCHSYVIDHAGMVVSQDTKYTLLGIYGMCVIFAIVIVGYLLDPVKTYRATSTDCQMIGNYAVSIVKCMVDKRFLLLIPLFLYSCMEMGFAFAEITKAFVTCPVGIYMVGYTMICFGICGGIGSYASGRLNKHIGRIPLITTACVIDLSLLLLMVLWQPGPGQVYAYFLLLGAWGIADGILISQSNSMVGAIFPDKLEEAYAAFRVTQGFGFCVSFAYGESLCMMDKMYILAATAIVGTALYIILEVIMKRSVKDIINPMEKEFEV